METNHQPIELIVIGGSAGSLQIIIDMIKKLDVTMDIPIVLVIHRKAQTTSILPALLQQFSVLEVLEVEDKTDLEHHKIYIVPADYHLLFENKIKMALDVSEKVNYCRPSIDVTFKSAAEIFGRNLIGILLSGANADGGEGLNYIKKNEGHIWVQDPSTAEVDYMPRQAIKRLKSDWIFRPEELAQKINQLNRKY